MLVSIRLSNAVPLLWIDLRMEKGNNFLPFFVHWLNLISMSLISWSDGPQTAGERPVKWAKKICQCVKEYFPTFRDFSTVFQSCPWGRSKYDVKNGFKSVLASGSWPLQFADF